MTAGGAVGLAEGLKKSAGERQRIRTNAVLNAMGRKGPGWGNGLGCAAMMYSAFESIAHAARETDDFLNPAGAAAVTGCIYKITAGPRVALPAGLALGAFAGVSSFISRQLQQRGLPNLSKVL
jgi:import inner membrane translocase subunit TIM23